MQSMIVGAMINIVAEALLLAQAAVADPADVRETIRGGFAGSRLLEVHGQRMLDRNFVPGGQVKSQLKDLRNVLAAVAGSGLVLPPTAAPAHNYESIKGELASADHSAALLPIHAVEPVVRAVNERAVRVLALFYSIGLLARSEAAARSVRTCALPP